MTSIKPKDISSPATGAVGSSSSEPASVERAGEGFRDALGRTEKTGSASGVTAAAVSAGASGDPIGELARAVQSGALSVERALEQLVERAASTMPGKLTSAQRAELTAVLQAALQSDPALQSLRERIG